MLRITPDLLLRAYALGVFPMAESRHDKELYWIDPKQRGVLPLDRFHVPHSVRKAARRRKFEIRVDTAFGRFRQSNDARFRDRQRYGLGRSCAARDRNLPRACA